MKVVLGQNVTQQAESPLYMPVRAGTGTKKHPGMLMLGKQMLFIPTRLQNEVHAIHQV